MIPLRSERTKLTLGSGNGNPPWNAGYGTQEWRNFEILVKSRESESMDTQGFALFAPCISPVMKEALTRKDENWGAVR
jgi:hypothetical protein